MYLYFKHSNECNIHLNLFSDSKTNLVDPKPENVCSKSVFDKTNFNILIYNYLNIFKFKKENKYYIQEM